MSKMKRIANLLHQAEFGMLIVVLVLVVFSTLTWMPFTFIYVEIGRFSGPIIGLVFSILILLLLVIGIPIIAFAMALRLKKHNSGWMVIFSLVMSFLILFSLSVVFMQRVSQAGERIDLFVAENRGLSFQEYVAKVSSFLDNNVHSAYKRWEGLFRSDNWIYGTLLGSRVVETWGATRADLIVYQGWGTCEQVAILIEELLHDAGYEARQARFKDIDHQWAEVKFNGTWQIIDPWYIGNFVEIQNLRNAKSDFQQASGVWVLYDNGTIVDSSPEHGY